MAETVGSQMRTRPSVFMIFGMVFSLGAILFFSIRKLVVLPVQEFGKAMNAASEDNSVRVALIDRGDEISLVAKGFNQMMDALSERERKITEQQTQMVSSSKMSALGEMASGIAHEINNPLAIIQGRAMQIAQLIDDNDLDKEALKKIAQKIDITAIRISKIIRGLKSFARNTENDPFIECSFKSVMEGVLDLCNEKFKKNGTPLMIDPIPDIKLECREAQISQVILNMLNNALDAIEELPEKWVKVIFTPKETLLQIQIVDSGNGIPPEVAAKMMQPFFTTKEVGKGTGLGLSISRGIIESHNGKLSLDTAHKNTCFVIELPYKQPITQKLAA